MIAGLLGECMLLIRPAHKIILAAVIDHQDQPSLAKSGVGSSNKAAGHGLQKTSCLQQRHIVLTCPGPRASRRLTQALNIKSSSDWANASCKELDKDR